MNGILDIANDAGSIDMADPVDWDAWREKIGVALPLIWLKALPQLRGGSFPNLAIGGSGFPLGLRNRWSGALACDNDYYNRFEGTAAPGASSATQNASFCAWVKFNTAYVYQPIFESRAGGSLMGLLVSGAYDPGNNNVTACWNGTSFEYDAGTALRCNLGEWTFTAGVVNGANLDTYRWSLSQGWGVYRNTITATDQSLAGTWYGGRDLGSTGIDGSIDDLILLPSAITFQQISALCQLSLSGYPDVLRRVPGRSWFWVGANSTAFTMTANAAVFAQTALSAQLKAARNLTCSTSTFVATGVSATLTFGHNITCVAGSFVETATAVALSATRILTCAAASYIETGGSTTLTKTRSMVASLSAFNDTAIASSLLATRLLTLGAASFTETGLDAVLNKTILAVAGLATYSETGQVAGLTATRKITATPASFVETGGPTTLTHNRTVTASIGGVNVTANLAGLLATRYLNVGLGSFTLTGKPATFFAGLRVISSANARHGHGPRVTARLVLSA